MSNIPLFARNKESHSHTTEEQENSYEEYMRKEVAMIKEKSKKIDTGLLDEVIDVLNSRDEEEEAYVLNREEESQREEELRQRMGGLNYDGYLEKKSPAHQLWQVNLFCSKLNYFQLLMMI